MAWADASLAGFRNSAMKRVTRSFSMIGCVVAARTLYVLSGCTVVTESLVPDGARNLPLKQFLARLSGWDDHFAQMIRTTQQKGQVLRYVATVTPRRLRVGLQAVSVDSPFAALKGTDNQIVFTTTRYREHPLVIRGPGAGPLVTAAGVLNDVLALARR